MKVRVEIESSEVVPPMLAETISNAISQHIRLYGYRVNVEMDSSEVVEANMRFMQWMTEQR